MTIQHERTSGAVAGKGLLLTFLAVVTGAFLLAQAFDGSGDLVDATSAADEDSQDSADETQEDEASPSDSNEGVNSAGNDGNAWDDPLTVTTTSTPLPVITRPPGLVKVATVNGTGIKGLAGATADILKSKGYVTLAKNAAAAPVARSSIFYKDSYANDAKAVASALSAPAELLAKTPTNISTLVDNHDNVADFNIFVVLGVDDKIPVRS